MSNVANWVVEDTISAGTGNIVLAGAVAPYSRFSEIAQDGPIWYSVIDSNTGNRETGVGVLTSSGTIIQRTDVRATLVDGVYNDTNPTAIVLSGRATVTCSFTKEAYDELKQEIAAISDIQIGTNQLSLRTLNESIVISKTSSLTDISKTDTSNVTYTVNDVSFEANDILRVRKTNQLGQLIITTANDQIAPDGLTQLSSEFPDGTAGTAELVFNGSVWNIRVY
jgi:hypothetical protein